ncbi:hypothetical protein [Smaragdicoccus niigatensis]|uniref:hypothetical protein n=1 Tax=Smaragdicoccus niigatensis TaxID=359359 RepID=UPI0003667CA4|nr:hypothetical protein [Smaragdicoccus niigatensis]
MAVGTLESKSASRTRLDYLMAAGALTLVAIAIAVPLINKSLHRRNHASTAPIFGEWHPHVGWGTVPALAIAAAVVWWGPDLAQRLSWRRLVAVTWLGNLAWTVSLVLVDSSLRGFGDPLTDKNEYLHDIPRISSIGEAVRDFSSRILDFQPDSWTTHVSGHPPGAFLTFVALDRLGLSGGTWAGLFVVITGSSAVVAVMLTIRVLGDADWARRTAPFLALAPIAVWVGTSADGWFMCVTAWGIALLAIAATTSNLAAGFASGLLLGFGVYLNYGLLLMGVPAVAVLWAARNWRPLVPALVGAVLVAAAFTLSGFWWLDGMHLVVQRYYQGIASERQFGYWVWANLAATVCAVGLATVAGLHRVRPQGAGMLPIGGLVAILAADLSALSKAETERIWLSFTIWLLAAAALLPQARRWLVVQAAGALLINHVILTNW